MHRRSSEDIEWQKTKAIVDVRDKRFCRCCAILLPSEVKQQEELSPPYQMLQQIDHAHVLPVGNNVTLTYDPTNVYCMCRWHHTHLDNLINPLTNKPMTQNEQWYWWVRVRYKKTWPYDESIDYEDLYHEMAKQKEDTKKKDVMSWW